MPEQWFFNREDGWGVQGPFDLSHLSQLVEKGEIVPQHKVRRGAIGQWSSAGDLKWFFNRKDGRGVQGPVARIHLCEMLEEEELTEETEVRSGWEGDWQPISLALKPERSDSADDPTARIADGDDFDSRSDVVVIEDESRRVIAPDEDAWFIQASEQDQGPLPWSRVHSLASLGRLNRNDKVRHGSAQQWQAADEFAGLFPKPSEATSPLPAPAPAQPHIPWYCQLGGMQMGPMTLDQLQRLVADDRLKATDHIRPADDETWRPAESISGLFEQEPAIVPEQPAIVPEQPATVPEQPAAEPEQPEAEPDSESTTADSPSPPALPPAKPTPALPPAEPVGEEQRNELQEWLDAGVTIPKEKRSKSRTAKRGQDKSPKLHAGDSFWDGLKGQLSARNPKIIGGIMVVAVIAAALCGAAFLFFGSNRPKPGTPPDQATAVRRRPSKPSANSNKTREPE